MDLRKVYYATNDAFDSTRTINKIYKAYFDSVDKADFVNNLRDTEKEDVFAFPVDDLERFVNANNETHIILFNKWLNDVRSINSLSVNEKDKFFEEVSRASHAIKTQLPGDGILNSARVKTAFNKVLNKVRKMGSVTKIAQINDFEKSFKDADISRLFEVLNYFSTENTGKELINIKSNYLFDGTSREMRNSVFLAVIPDKINIFEFVNEYLRKCKEYEVRYDVDIPYDTHTKQVVRINSTIEDLGKNLAIVQDIADSNPEMIKKMKKPPVLCGTIKEWIGIGTYSCKGNERTTFGFTEKRGNLIYDAIDEYSNEFIKENYTKQYTVDGKTKDLRSHISDITTEIAIEDLRVVVSEYYESMKKDYGELEAEKQVKTYFGLHRRDLYEAKYLKRLRKNIDASVEDMIAADFKTEDGFFGFRIPNSSIGFGRDMYLNIVPKVFKAIQKDILIRNPKFISESVREMRSRFKEQGIDEITCFEDYVVDKMFEEEKKQEPALVEPLPIKTTKKIEKEDR